MLVTNQSRFRGYGLNARSGLMSGLMQFRDFRNLSFPRFLMPVSNEISDLRNFWLHTMDACTG